MRKVRQFLFKDYAMAPLFIKWTSAASDSSKSLERDSPLRADLIASSSSPPTPLFLACSFGWLSIICDDICTFGNADWNQRNDNGNTGITLAAVKGHEVIVKLLVKKGAKLDSKDGDGQTPLSWAAENRHGAVVKLLAKKGAKLESKDING